METLASILAGLPSDPTQVSPGISSLLTQALLGSQMGNQALAQGAQQPAQPGMPGQYQGVPGLNPAAVPTAFGSMGGMLPASIGSIPGY